MTTYTIDDYLLALDRFDWTYDWSDDYHVWERGVKAEEELFAMARLFDPDKVMLKAKAPKDWLIS